MGTAVKRWIGRQTGVTLPIGPAGFGTREAPPASPRRAARNRVPPDYDDRLAEDWLEDVRSLLEAPSPAVLTTYRKDGSALVTPVWFRWHDGGFSVVIAKGDVKLRHLSHDPRCILVVFETVPPFRGMEVHGVPELIEGDVTDERVQIAGRYLGSDRGRQYAELRKSKPGVLLRLAPDEPRVWNLSAMLPP